MVRASAPLSWRALAVAVGGGLAFVASLLYFALSYLFRFDALAPAAPAWPPVVVNLALFTAFALHHSLFARTGVKAWITRTVPPALERSTYVWISSLLFIGVCAWWRPVPGQIWHVDGAWRAVLLAAQAVAGVFTLVAARRLDVLELAGVRQVLGSRETAPILDDRGPYTLVRHPIYLAWIGLVWLTPSLTGTRLVFAAVSTAYLLAAVPFEERDLRRMFGDAYAAYSRKVKWRVLPFIY